MRDASKPDEPFVLSFGASHEGYPVCLRKFFYSCSSLNTSYTSQGTTVELPFNLDTSSVTNMDNMFYRCTNLSTLTLPASFDTSSVTDMSFMFYSCSQLSTLTLPTFFDTSSVTNMTNMFSNCRLSTLTLPASFDTSSVTNMSSMFSNCSSLSTLTLPASFDTSSVTDMSSMFSNCRLSTLTLPASFDTSSVTNMSSMFSNCSSLSTLTLPASFDTSSVTHMGSMFRGCSSLSSMELPAVFFNSNTYNRSYEFDSVALTQVTITTSSNMSPFSSLPSLQGNNIVCYGTDSGAVVDGARYDIGWLRVNSADNTSYTFVSTDETLSVYFYSNGGQYPGSPDPTYVKEVTGNKGDAINTPFGTDADTTKIVNGDRAFLGWSANPYAKDAEYGASGSVEVGKLGVNPFNTAFYAIWEPVTCNVIFDATSGYFGNVSTKQIDLEEQVGFEFNLPDNLVAPAGKKFVGWTKKNGKDMPKLCIGATAYYAHYEDKGPEDLISVSFSSGEGSWEDGKHTAVVYGKKDTIVVPPISPVLEGYILSNWLGSDGSTLSSTTTFGQAEGIVYTAQFVSTPTPPGPTDMITITFDAGSGSWNGDTQIQVLGTKDQRLIAPISPELAEHTLIGWLSDTGEWLEPTTTFEQGNGHVYTAQYVESIGWHQNENGWYYIYDLSNNYYTNCWALINSAWFYFNDAGYCLEYTWGYINGEWYFFGWGGYMQTGWQWLGGSWYFLDRYTGAMKCGWVHDGVWYYCDAALGGAMYDNCWAYINGAWYGFNQGGSMTQGWSWSYAYDGWFYLQPDTGHMLYGWQYIGGHWYYFYDNGLMAANTYVGTYWLGSDGAMW